jgi:serine/threonine-protein kinase
MVGKTLAHYEITALLGRGGMGEVYRAHDTKLGRDVALKLLPPELADDAERVERFRREARTLASLQHPNIAAIHGLDEDEGRLFLTMELVEGEDLAAWIARGPLAVDEAVEIAVGIARGLEAAHARGVVHRDLKPANVKIATDGTPKILDFGLARAMTGETVGDEDLGTSPTITAAMTQAGTILGTAAYMSPEQARGRSVDHRADNWAFGVMLWEMLAGKPLFAGETTSDVLASVLKQAIDPREVPENVPSRVRRVLARCLQRDPRERLHAIADARLELQATYEETDGWSGGASGGGQAGRSGPHWLPWLLAAALACAVLVLAWRPWSSAAPPDETGPLAVSVNLPPEMPLALIDWTALAVSPDGRHLALSVRVDDQKGLVVRSLAAPAFHVILDQQQAYNVFMSPDGQWLGYTANNRFRKTSIDGGVPVDIVETAHPRGATWGDDGYVYYSPHYSTGILRVRDTGDATPETLTVLDPQLGERTHRWPDALPGGRGVLFTVGDAASPGDYEDAEIAVHDNRTGTTRRLGVRGAIARYAATGHLVVAREGVLHAVRFDLETLTVAGRPQPVLDGVRGDRASGMYYFDIDDTGTLYYVAAREGGPQRRLTWVDRDGIIENIDLPPGTYRYPRLDPESKRAVLVLGEGHGNNDDLYTLDLDDLSLTRVTFDRTSMGPNWIPGTNGIVHASVSGLRLQARTLGRDASVRGVPGTEDMILLPTSVGRDGRTVLATRLGASTLGDVILVDLADSTRAGPIVETPAAEWAADLSPDLKWFVYVSDETGREEIFLQPFPVTGAKWQISTDGGRAPRWSADGREIFFVRGDGMYGVAIATEPELRIQNPELLFEHRMDSSGVPVANYDVSADGQRFLIVEPDADADAGSVEVIVGWGQTLEKSEL